MQEVLFEKQGETALVTLNRPQNLNALNTSLATQLADILEGLEPEKEIRTLVITGAGRAFSAGGDVKEFRQQQDRRSYILELTSLLNRCISSIRRMPKTVIAAVNGVASGAGMSMVLACDLAIADEEATLNMAYIKIAASPDGGGSLTLTRTLGLKKASELIFSGRMVNTQEALDLGLVNEITSSGRAVERALELAQGLNQAPPLAIAASKELINRALFYDLQTHLEAERRSIAYLGTTTDFQEGLEAFFQKRLPKFKGT